MRLSLRFRWLSATLAIALTTPAFAQPATRDASKNQILFLSTARKLLKWDEPAEPAKIAGPIYFVGTQGLSSYLITTPEGHIVIDTGMPASGPMIESSIRKLGFKPEDIKILLVGHAHCDHVGGHAYLKKLSGGKIAMLREEKELFESGGKSDFMYGAYKEFEFEPSKVDIMFTDGEQIKLGNVAITALRTSGHTRGTTTYATKIADGGRDYSVAIVDGTSVNPGYRLVNNPSYEGIANDYRRTLHVLEGLKPDIWLHAHNEVHGLKEKLARSATAGAQAWVDPEGYKRWLEEQKQKFANAIQREREAGAN